MNKLQLYGKLTDLLFSLPADTECRYAVERLHDWLRETVPAPSGKGAVKSLTGAENKPVYDLTTLQRAVIHELFANQEDAVEHAAARLRAFLQEARIIKGARLTVAPVGSDRTSPFYYA